MLRWQLIAAKDVVYAVFTAKENEEFNFDQPTLTTRQDIYKYTPKNIFSETATCFVVRVSNLAGDENENVKCTEDQPFSFEGLTDIERQSDGAYLLNWNKIPVEGTVFTVFEREAEGEYNFDLPSFDAIENIFFKTKVYERGKSTCFIVRYSNSDLPTDENLNEICTEVEAELVFGGVGTLTETAVGTVKMTWTKPTDKAIVGYNIYQGSDFKEKMGELPVDTTTFTIEGLVPGRQYSFGVKAVDEYEREDNNIKILPIVMSGS